MGGQNFSFLDRISSFETRGIKHNNVNKISGKSFILTLN